MKLKEERKQKIIAYMKEEAYKSLLFKELAGVLGVPSKDIHEFDSVIAELEQEGKIFKTSKQRYDLPERLGLVSGRLQGNERGYGFVIPDEEDGQDIFIPADGMNGAMHNDRVIAKIERKAAKGKKIEGEVIRVLKRANTRIVGTFEKSKYFGFVISDEKRIPGDIFIPKNETGGAKNGQKVVAEIIVWPEKRRNAEGRIVEILGNPNDPGVDILAILKSYGIEQDFPEKVLKEVSKIPDTVSNEMIKGRKDLRKLRMVTIDSEDAKDLDDAVSIERLKNGDFRLGVHIADVSEYVKEGAALDKEALKRGTSVYPVDRVVPMLPEKLSNGVCSLNPQTDRLALTVFMDIDHTGNVYNHEIYESVINTDERMTYANVTKILDQQDEELMKRYNHLVEDFRLMEELSAILYKKRYARGSIDFDFYEAKIKLDGSGKPIEVKKRERTIADKIIEEFMLVCNETIAEHFFWNNIPFIYRIHEEPDEIKLNTFRDFMAGMGYAIKIGSKIHPKTLQQILEKIKGEKEEMIVSTVMLRSLMKAKYSDKCTGHFGLAAKYYCHFTSPIRRYPDLMIHRIIKEHLHNDIDEKREQRLSNLTPEIAKVCSERERAADEAERAAEDLKKVEFMKGKEGEVYEGVISSILHFGMFVELENTIEGFVHLEDMEDDFYVYDEKHMSLIGQRKSKIYRIGDAVSVKVARVDVAARRISFILTDENNKNNENSRAVAEKGKRKTEAGKHAARNAGKSAVKPEKGRSKSKPKFQKKGKKARLNNRER